MMPPKVSISALNSGTLSSATSGNNCSVARGDIATYAVGEFSKIVVDENIGSITDKQGHAHRRPSSRRTTVLSFDFKRWCL